MTWPNLGGNANVVPVVANGKVYVASYQSLMIFGPNAPATAAVSTAAGAKAARAEAPAVDHTLRVSGTLLSVEGSVLTLAMRGGKTVRIDDSAAAANERIAILVPGEPYTVVGEAGTDGVDVQALAVSRAKDAAAAWPEDRFRAD